MQQNIPVTIPDMPSQDPLPKALDAIQSNQPGQAHRYLLQALRDDPQNIQVWLLLGWTAPTSETAAFYFQHLLKQHPDNPLSRQILPLVNQKSENRSSGSGSSVEERKQLITRLIDYLENEEVESQVTDHKSRPTEITSVDRITIQVESKSAGRKPRAVNIKTVAKQGSPVVIQSTKKMAMHVGIPESLRIPLVYLAALALAEGITTLAIPQIGLILHGVLLVTLILHATLFARRGQQKFLITLTLAPLIRLMSLSLPLLDFPYIYWYAVIGVPLFLAAFLALRVTGFKAALIGLNGRALPWQLVVGLTGLGLGFVEYMILHPAPLVEALTWQQIWLPALILLLFTGLLEEIIFRGLIQRGATGTIGRYGLVYVAILFAVLHFGYRSVWDVVFVFTVALFFGFVVARTGSLLGVTLSHGLTNVALYLIIPFLMNGSTNPAAAIPQTVIEKTARPIVWVMPDVNTKLITPDEGDVGITHRYTQWELIKTTPGVKPEWVYLEDREAKTNVIWPPRIYGTRSTKDCVLLKLADFRSPPSPIGYCLVTVE